MNIDYFERMKENARQQGLDMVFGFWCGAIAVLKNKEKEMKAEFLKNEFKEKTENFPGVKVNHGSVVGVLKKACGNNDANYRLVLKALTGKTSSKELDEAQFYALFCLVQPTKGATGPWTSVDMDLLVQNVNSLIRSLDDVPEQTRFA